MKTKGGLSIREILDIFTTKKLTLEELLDHEHFSHVRLIKHPCDYYQIVIYLKCEGMDRFGTSLAASIFDVTLDSLKLLVDRRIEILNLTIISGSYSNGDRVSFWN